MSFIGLTLKPLFKLALLGIFRPKRLVQLSGIFSDIYSDLWDFAEHSISHGNFTLPSTMGDRPVDRVNKCLSRLYGGKFASLSFGGSSGALLTLLTAVLPKLCPGRDLILFDGVCHQSTIGGLIFGRWKAVRLIRETHQTFGTVCPVTYVAVKEVIEHHGPDRFAAIILVLPSYDGFRSPSEDVKIYNYARSRGISVIVDGAWDALRFRHSDQTQPRLSNFCDVWVTSPHKRGLTPSSLGCIVTDNENIARLWDDASDLGFRSSSVSFVEIMIAEHRLTQVMSGNWDRYFDDAEKAAEQLSNRIQEIHPALHIVQPSNVGAEAHDSTHVLISTYDLPDLDARQWAARLAHDFALDVEKSTQSTVLLLCGSPEHLTQVDQIISCLKGALTNTLAQNQDLKNDQ